MLMRCERRGSNVECQCYADFESELNQVLRQAERLVLGQPHKCDGCGETAPDVDLWAENSETGEQIWLCETCRGW